MPEIITAKIDCCKIQKERLFAGKNGAKYLDIVLIPTPNNQYGDSHMIVQAVSKEEREAGKRGPILGNAKILQSRQQKPANQERTPASSESAPPTDNSEVPF